jgi:hypothetical protein
VTFDEAPEASAIVEPDWIALDDAQKALEATDVRKSRMVELRFFGGLSVEETAEVLQVSPDTVHRDWRFAKSWLRRELTRGRDMSDSGDPSDGSTEPTRSSPGVSVPVRSNQPSCVTGIPSAQAGSVASQGSVRRTGQGLHGCQKVSEDGLAASPRCKSRGRSWPPWGSSRPRRIRLAA